MKKYSLFPLLLLISSPLVAHPGHGSMPLGDVWFVLGATVVLAIAGLIGYRRYLEEKKDD